MTKLNAVGGDFLSVAALNKQSQKREESRHECFQKVLKKCHNYITKHNEKNVKCCFFEVPEFIIGHPPYDLNECITYIREVLQSKGFLVKYYFPHLLYISWNQDEIKEERLKEGISMIKALEGPSAPIKSAVKKRAPARPKTAGGRALGTTTKNVSFVNSVKEFTPRGKLVLDLM